MARIIKASGPERSDTAGPAIMSLTDIASEARSVVLDARKQAARIVAEARAEADRACEAAARQGYDEGVARGQNDGYEDGFRRGRADAAETFAKDAAGLLELVDRIAGELKDAREHLLHRGRCELLDFAVEIAERIVGRVARSDPAAAEANLRKALEIAETSRSVRVKVNPGQLAALRRCAEGVAESLGRAGGIELTAEEGISPGGVKVLAGPGEIDATIEAQWSNVVEALVGSRPAGRPEPAANTETHREAEATPLPPGRALPGPGEPPEPGAYEPAGEGGPRTRQGGKLSLPLTCRPSPGSSSGVAAPDGEKASGPRPIE